MYISSSACTFFWSSFLIEFSGRGLRTWNHCGNERLRELVQQKLPGYSMARSRVEKSSILCSIIQLFRQESPEAAGFVKQDLRTKLWHTVEDLSARATVAQAFRDALSNRYRSSKHSKRERRWNQKSERPDLDSDSVTVPILPKDELAQPMASLSATSLCSEVPQPKPLQMMQGILDDALEAVDASAFEEDLKMNLFLSNFENKIEEDPWGENPFEPTPISPLVDSSRVAATNHHAFSKPTYQVESSFRLIDALSVNDTTPWYCGV